MDEIANKNVESVRAFLKGLNLKIINAKSGLYIHGKRDNYFISRLDLEEISKDSRMYIQQFVEYIYRMEA
jgi:hypothetical protein